jgi:hypothetical protein
MVFSYFHFCPTEYYSKSEGLNPAALAWQKIAAKCCHLLLIFTSNKLNDISMTPAATRQLNKATDLSKIDR